MTQLSTNTVVYDQIIKKVSKFIVDYRENRFPTNQKLLEEYQSLITFLNERASGPLTDFVPFIKGEPPISQKFNSFTSGYSDDINVISKQLDYISAGLINSFNLFTSEIEQENKFINRIKSKIKVLQMYSSGPSNDLYYFGNSFDSSDYIDFTKIKNSSFMPLIDNGQMTLSIKEIKNWSARYVFIEPESNGYPGNNHEAYMINAIDSNYKFVFQDTPTSRNKENIRDDNPSTFFEYEQINIPSKPQGSKDYEFKYINSSGASTAVTYTDWSTFNGESLKLALVLEAEFAQPANFVNILPYFGSGNSLSKDIKVSRIEITNDKNEVENLIQEPIWVSSSFIPSSLEKAKYFYYREAKIRFEERNVKQIKIIFEQSEFSDIKARHLYYRPDSTTRAGNPYYGQTRFDPDNPAVVADLKYPTIPWSSKIYNSSSLIPNVNTPNLLKAEVNNTNQIDVILQRNIPKSTGYCLELRGTDGVLYRITNRFFDNFNEETARLSGLAQINNTNISTYISSGVVNSSSTDNSSPYLSSSTSAALKVGLDNIVTWFNTSNADGTSQQKYAKFNIQINSARVVETNSSDSELETRNYKINLVREYQVLDAQRKSIGIRDISLGLETYEEAAQVVSRKYDVPAEIEYVTFSAESGFSGSVNADVNDYIEYSLSFDEGVSWVKIASIESPFEGTPEVIALNQNIEERFRLPGVSYLFPPKIPDSVKGFIVKVDMKKPTSKNVSPILYSYKVGVKVKQS